MKEGYKVEGVRYHRECGRDLYNESVKVTKKQLVSTTHFIVGLKSLYYKLLAKYLPLVMLLLRFAAL